MLHGRVAAYGVSSLALFALLALIIPHGAVTAQSPTLPTPVQLPTPGGTEGIANAVNDAGQIVGWIRLSSGDQRATLWDNRRVVDLGTPTSMAFDINRAGAIVGSAVLTPGVRHAVLWTNGQAVDLGTLGGNYSIAYAINDRNQVVGLSATASGEHHAFLWENGTMKDLMIPSVSHAWANDINNRGQIAGVRMASALGPTAFIWESGLVTDLVPLGGPNGFAKALGINDLGQVVGTSGASLDPFLDHGHATLWDHGQVIDLGTLGGSTSSASAIANNGLIAGEAAMPSDAYHACLFAQGQSQGLPPMYAAARGINARGWIVGYRWGATVEHDNQPMLWRR